MSEWRNATNGITASSIAIATAKGVIKSKDSNLLVESGGHLDINKDWAKRFLGRMNLVKQCMITKAKIFPANFDDLKSSTLADIHTFHCFYRKGTNGSHSF